MNPTIELTARAGGIRYSLVALLMGLPISFVVMGFLMPGCGR